MPFLSDKDRINLNAILESVSKIKKFTKGIASSKEFYQDEKTFDSVLMNFIVIGESVAKLDEDLKKNKFTGFMECDQIIQKHYRT